MKRVFICSPFRADTVNSMEMNIINAKAWGRAVAMQGHTPFVPHLLYPQFLNDEIAAERSAGIRCGLDFLTKCDELWYFGHTISSGMMTEIQAAHLAGVPVRCGLGQMSIAFCLEGGSEQDEDNGYGG